MQEEIMINMSTKKIVITGATGFIGVHLIKEWLTKDCEIYAIVRPGSSNRKRIPQSDRVHCLEVNMDQYSKLPEMITTCDSFYHLAWEGARAPMRDDVLLQKKNYLCALQAFEAANKMGCKFFLGSGSQAEYGITSGIVNENYPCNPVNEYGKQKLNTYLTLSKMTEEANMRFAWTRIFSIYGPYDYPGTLIMQCIDKMKKDEPIEMTAGTQLWDYLYVSDAARSMQILSDSDCENGVYIVASGDYHPLQQFVLRIKKELGSQSDLQFGKIPYGPNGAVNLMPDPAKLKNSTGWEPLVGFSEGIAKTAAAYAD